MSSKKQCRRLHIRREFIWGFKNCNWRDTASDKTDKVFWERERVKTHKDKSQEVIKSFLMRIVIDSDANQEIFVLKESPVILG